MPFGPVHRGLACCHVRCLLFPKGMIARQGRNHQERQNLANLARTVSCIAPARPEEQIQSCRAIDPLSYATTISTPSWLGLLSY